MNKITKLAMAVCMATSVGALAQNAEPVSIVRLPNNVDLKFPSVSKEHSIAGSRLTVFMRQNDDLSNLEADCAKQGLAQIAHLLRSDAQAREQFRRMVDWNIYPNVFMRQIKSVDKATESDLFEITESGQMTIGFGWNPVTHKCIMKDEAELKAALAAGIEKVVKPEALRNQRRRNAQESLDKGIEDICAGKDECEARH